jgi:hypothetical protein
MRTVEASAEVGEIRKLLRGHHSSGVVIRHPVDTLS